MTKTPQKYRSKTKIKNNGDSKNPLYDFPYPTEDEENIKLKNKAIIKEIKKNEKKLPWIQEINRLPYALKQILIKELNLGNSIVSINNSNWPQNGSIVIKFNKSFAKESKMAEGTKWRLLDDPHYYKEEISQLINDIEFLLIN